MKTRYSIRIRPERIAGEDGHWFEIRDAQRRVVRSSWGLGAASYARDDARRAVQALEHEQQKSVAA